MPACVKCKGKGRIITNILNGETAPCPLCSPKNSEEVNFKEMISGMGQTKEPETEPDHADTEVQVQDITIIKNVMSWPMPEQAPPKDMKDIEDRIRIKEHEMDNVRDNHPLRRRRD